MSRCWEHDGERSPSIARQQLTFATMVTTPEDVLTFVPNLIGYTRVVFALVSFLLMLAYPRLWIYAVVLYVGGFIGDLFDGMAARKLNQTSSFGGVLDMVTDRCSTLGLLYVLGLEYADFDAAVGFPVFRLTFLFLQLLDISSHWCQMHSSLALGLHHKSDEGNADKHFLVRWFYKYYWFFGYLCVGAEFTYVAAYIRVQLLRMVGRDVSLLLTALHLFLCLSVPACMAKQAVNVMQLCSSCYAIAKDDAKKRNTKETKVS